MTECYAVLCYAVLCCNEQEEKLDVKKKDSVIIPVPVKLDIEVLRAVPPAVTDADAADAADSNATAMLAALNSKAQQRRKEYDKLRSCAGVAVLPSTTAATAAATASAATNGSSKKRKASSISAGSTSSSTTNGTTAGSGSGSSSAGLLSAYPSTLQEVCIAVAAQVRSPPLVFSGELLRVLMLENRYGKPLEELLQGIRQVCTLLAVAISALKC
jgi:hypothetical protein